jgi:hypothetical protein
MRALLLVLAFATAAAARPLYFDNVTAMFDIREGDRLHVCGVCHRRWEGTGPRNRFGTAVEQQLYVGKSIRDAVQAVLAEDADGDGTSNGDELATFRTLPGYACDNFEQAIDAPPEFQGFITPGVPTCLEPKDIRVSTTSLAYQTRLGREDVQTFTVFNNGAQFPLTLTGYTGTDAAFTVSGPALPAVLAVGDSAVLTVAFHPTASGVRTGTVRVESDDPDEPAIDVALSGIGFVRPVAPAPARAACLADVQRALERYTRAHLAEWTRCWLEELRGIACDTGARDRRLARARAKLRLAVGGRRDRHCTKETLTPARLGMESTCGGGCGTIRLASLADLTTCLDCRQSAATDAVLTAVVGAAPPDRPANRPGAEAYRCNQGLVRAMSRSIPRLQQALGECALANVTAATPVDCAESLAATLAREGDAIDAARAACEDTAGLAGCLFEGEMPDQTCLRTTASGVAQALVQAVFVED